MRIHHMSIWWWDFIMTSCWYEDSMPRQNDDKCQYDDDAGGRSGFERFSELVDFTCNLSKWWWITPQDPSAAPIWHSDILERPKSSPKQYQCMFHIKILNHENAQFPFSPDHQGEKLSTTTPKLWSQAVAKKATKDSFWAKSQPSEKSQQQSSEQESQITTIIVIIIVIVIIRERMGRLLRQNCHQLRTFSYFCIFFLGSLKNIAQNFFSESDVTLRSGVCCEEGASEVFLNSFPVERDAWRWRI